MAARVGAVFFASLYLFTMPRFGLISLPRWFNPACKYLSVFCIGMAAIFSITPVSPLSFLRDHITAFAVVWLVIGSLSASQSNQQGWLKNYRAEGEGFKSIVSAFAFSILPLIALGVVVYHQPQWLWNSFVVVAFPFLIFSTTALFMIVKEWTKEHPIYREWAIFGRGGAARFGGLYTFFRYDFTAFLAGREVRKHRFLSGAPSGLMIRA